MESAAKSVGMQGCLNGLMSKLDKNLVFTLSRPLKHRNMQFWLSSSRLDKEALTYLWGVPLPKPDSIPILESLKTAQAQSLDDLWLSLSLALIGEACEQNSVIMPST